MSRPTHWPDAAYSSWSLTMVSWGSRPAFWASTLGITSSASANACTPGKYKDRHQQRPAHLANTKTDISKRPAHLANTKTDISKCLHTWQIQIQTSANTYTPGKYKYRHQQTPAHLANTNTDISKRLHTWQIQIQTSANACTPGKYKYRHQQTPKHLANTNTDISKRLNTWQIQTSLGCLVVFNVPSTARSFRDGTPIYCPLRKTWSSINTPFWPGNEPRAIAWQSITLPLRYASSTYRHQSIPHTVLIWYYVQI